VYSKIDHVGVAVRSLRKALEAYEAGLGFRAALVEDVPEQHTRVAMLPIGESRIELLEATDENSPIARFIAKRGEGMHHICFQAEDLAGELRQLQRAGVRLIDTEPRPGAGGCLVAFIHPEGTGGVLVELSQPAPNHHHSSSDK
jgi:methylmalonyl-CoA/ethylmalonyl-CoA epimerase